MGGRGIDWQAVADLAGLGRPSFQGRKGQRKSSTQIGKFARGIAWNWETLPHILLPARLAWPCQEKGKNYRLVQFRHGVFTRSPEGQPEMVHQPGRRRDRHAALGPWRDLHIAGLLNQMPAALLGAATLCYQS